MASISCTRRRRWARSISASCRARAAWIPAPWSAQGEIDFLFLLGVDEFDVPAGRFVVYQGSHGDAGAHRADVILPGAAYPEKSGLYVNFEGRVQLADAPPSRRATRRKTGRSCALCRLRSTALPYDTLAGLRREMYAVHPHMMRIGGAPGIAADVGKLAKLGGRRGGVQAGGRGSTHQPDRARQRDHGGVLRACCHGRIQ